MTADALLFDFGNVVVDIDFERVVTRWAEHAGCDVAQLRSRFSHDEAYKRHEVGAISAEEYFATLRTSLGIDIADEEFLDGWNVLFGKEIPGISTILETTNGRIPLYLFSNSNRAHEAFWMQRFAEVLKNFTTVFVSSTIGLRKPDAAAFGYICEEIRAPAERIMFFDDLLENIEGAQACGFHAIHATKASDVETALSPMLR